MTGFVLNDPAWWPLISGFHVSNYFVVVSSAVVVYDWALTFTQEFELIWKHHWSFMTVLYICVRYIGMLYSLHQLHSMGSPSPDDRLSNILYFTWTWTPVVVNAVLGVIMLTRIHAMYGRSSKMLVFLAVLLLVSTITTVVMVIPGEAVLSGYHKCFFNIDEDVMALGSDMMIPTAIWEILAFCLAVWIVIKHLRELRQLQRGSTIWDCFTVLIQSHALYFLAFVVMACLTLGSLSPYLENASTLGATVYNGILDIAMGLQMCVLGPRLILGVREYNAKLVDGSDEGTHMTSIAFQAAEVLTGGDV
ncbi:hypothetical protein DEU56DRAFT_909111 [Suillus clintonianus]|uniref:uncharacterized protein n=1 Tax=Suillus clintonianus TaxID=1904413 RepID=UPI001B876D0A|nr:uncharacterized protein DEU56DRAFT_909111 [Suillus clintonianus]KAG2148800.1 hypothetical protein DEU56DRAFT_909111 [Suillus clintonianus]